MEEENPFEVGGFLFPYIRCLAHDMATPLLTVIGYSQMLLSDLEDEQLSDVEAIENSAQRLRSQLALLSRLSRYLPEEKTCSAYEFCQDFKSLTQSAANGTQCRICWEEEGGDPSADLLCNPWTLRAAVLGLISCLFENSELSIRSRQLENVLEISLQFEKAPLTQAWKLALRSLASLGASVKADRRSVEIELRLC